MRAPLRSVIVLVTLLVLAVLAPSARAASAFTASHDHALAGEAITFEWQGLSADAHEVELELSLDGGRWIRISPGLEPRDGRFVWTVPGGLSGAGRVRLRVGGRHDEAVVAELALRVASEMRLGPSSTNDAWWSLESHGAPCDAVRETAVWSSLTNVTVFTHDPSPTHTGEPARVEVESPSTAEPTAAPAEPRAFTAPRRTPLRN